MTSKYIYSQRAAQQTRKIYKDTFKKWGIAQADAYDAQLLKTIKLLAENPDIGHECNDIKKHYRRFEVGRHIIFYRKQQDNIFITAVVHDRMDVKRQLNG